MDHPSMMRNGPEIGWSDILALEWDLYTSSLARKNSRQGQNVKVDGAPHRPQRMLVPDDYFFDSS